MVTLGHSIGFQSNLVHEQKTLSPTSCSQKINDFRFCTVLAFLKHDRLEITWEGLGLDTLSNTETSKPCIIQSMA